MEPPDKRKRTQELSGDELEEQGGENVGSHSGVDLFNEHEVEEPGHERVEREGPNHGRREGVKGARGVSGFQKEIFVEKEPDGPGEEEDGSGRGSERPSGSKSVGGEERGSDRDPGNRSIKRRNKGRKARLSLYLAVGIILLAGIGYKYIKDNLLESNHENFVSFPEKKVFPVPKEEKIVFDSFIIPFEGNERFTYISLSVVIILPNKEIRREISRKRDQIRGILYEMFVEEINRTNRIPPMDHLKTSIIRTVNAALTVGVVKEVYVTQFLAV